MYILYWLIQIPDKVWYLNQNIRLVTTLFNKTDNLPTYFIYNP